MKNYKWTWLFAMVFLIPIVLNFILSQNTPNNMEVIGGPELWLSFYGSYIGGVFTAIIGFVTIHRSERTNRLQIEISQKIAYIKDLELRLADCISIFDYSRIGVISLYFGDISKYNEVLKEMDAYLNRVTKVTNSWGAIYADSEKKEINEFQNQLANCFDKLTKNFNDVSKLIIELKRCDEQGVEQKDRSSIIYKINSFIEYHQTFKSSYLIPLWNKARAWIDSEKKDLQTLKSKLEK